MPLLERLSQTLWSYLSPTKPANTGNTPQTVPKFNKPRRPLRRTSLEDVIKRSRSMSPNQRVHRWHLPSSGGAIESVTEKKRKRAVTPSTDTSRRVQSRKSRKMDDVNMDEAYGDEDVSEEVSEEESGLDESMEDVSTSLSHIRVQSRSTSGSPSRHTLADEEAELDQSLVVDEADYGFSAQKRRMMVAPKSEHLSKGVSTEELRAQGWDDDHIVLVQKIAMRGYEPLMPNFWRFDYRFTLPDSLFVATDGDDSEAIICSVRGEERRGTMALDKLFELGGRVRDRVSLQNSFTPEQQVRRSLNEYIKWAQRDSGLDKRTAIPLLTIETQPVDTDAEEIKGNAKRKCTELAQRYRNAFRVLQSIENSPGSRTSTQVSYPTPTLYAIIASHTLIALTAYNPEDAEPDIKIVAMFEMKDRDYDVWNALALAIVVCHVRNVQMRIAEETGLGVKSGAEEEDVEVDWDL